MYAPPSNCKEKAEGKKTSLRYQMKRRLAKIDANRNYLYSMTPPH
jgi:hypothetical protein